MKTLSIELMVDDISNTIAFYTDVLGFAPDQPNQKDLSFASVSNGGVKIMFYLRDEFSKEIPKFKNIALGGRFVMYIEVDEIEALYERIKGKVKIIQELYQTDYGSKEFSIEDNNGYVLMFSEK